MHHKSAYVSIRQHTSAYVGAYLDVDAVKQMHHKSAYVSIRQHTSAYISTYLEVDVVKQMYLRAILARLELAWPLAPVRMAPPPRAPSVPTASAPVKPPARFLDINGLLYYYMPTVRMCHTHLAYVSIRQHTSAYVSIRQHTSAYVSIRQHTSAFMPPVRVWH
jgi:hypothetical protein